MTPEQWDTFQSRTEEEFISDVKNVLGDLPLEELQRKWKELPDEERDFLWLGFRRPGLKTLETKETVYGHHWWQIFQSRNKTDL